MHPRTHLEELLKAGWPAVQRWVDEKASETNTLEFKTVTTTPGATSLSAKDRDTIAKVVSGLANTDGGLLVLGVAAYRPDNKHDRDVVRDVEHVADVHRFAELAGTAARDCVEPKVAAVSAAPIEDPSKAGCGVVIVHVPRSFGGPHRVVGGAKDVANHYFMRTVGSTSVIPHRMLAALFNARPEPRLVLDAIWDEPNSVLLSLRNLGPGTARNIRVVATVADWLGEEIGVFRIRKGCETWEQRGLAGAMLRPQERVFAEEPCEVGQISLVKTMAQAEVDGIKLHARVDSETTRPLFVRGELLRRDELHSFGLPADGGE